MTETYLDGRALLPGIAIGFDNLFMVEMKWENGQWTLDRMWRTHDDWIAYVVGGDGNAVRLVD